MPYKIHLIFSIIEHYKNRTVLEHILTIGTNRRFCNQTGTNLSRESHVKHNKSRKHMLRMTYSTKTPSVGLESLPTVHLLVVSASILSWYVLTTI